VPWSLRATIPSPPAAAARRGARTILARLKKRYPLAGTALDYRDPWQLLVATVLSAQTTDANVNRVTPGLFARWPSVEDLAEADPEQVEAVVYSTGYYRQKARSVIALSADLVERFGGEVPSDLAALISLRGVGRKTASVVLAEAFRRPAIAVDTHVGRLARRLDLSRHLDPAKVEADLQALYPPREWAGISMRFILFGREVCTARRPRCGGCPLADRCPYPGKTAAG
jgi:endonuclease-3